MSQKEVSRLEVVQKILAKELSQVAAAQQLHLSSRQVRRLCRSYALYGPKGLISSRRGKVSNNRLPETLKQDALALIREHYYDFGPTFAHEKLTQVHQLKLSVETLRQWMLEAQLWQGKKRKQVPYHPRRPRRPCLGELVQIDGSRHAWFEERGPECCLLVFIDDATGRLMELQFVPHESTQGYFDATYRYLSTHGKPVAFYSDRHGIFRVNASEVEDTQAETQFARALRQCDIHIICARSPQAKGRVEKVNGTLQDRLVKELRLRNICDITAANTFLATFCDMFNHRFAKPPVCPINQHRPCHIPSSELRHILSHQEIRIITKNFEVHYRNRIYQIQRSSASYTMRRAKILVCESHGQVTLWYNGRSVPFYVLDKPLRRTSVASSNQINSIVDQYLLSLSPRS